MKKFLTYTLLGVLLAGCAGSGREPLETVVDKALAGAERQTLLMAEKYSAREGRLPRTWENGEDVSSDSRWSPHEKPSQLGMKIWSVRQPHDLPN